MLDSNICVSQTISALLREVIGAISVPANAISVSTKRNHLKVLLSCEGSQEGVVRGGIAIIF